jgi:AAA+ ATPase superfamily predicted ATPase
MEKPADVFDRQHEWRALDGFVGSAQAGATLGLVYGRRRQGKTFLLEALVEARGGLYVAALEQSSRQNLDRLAERYQAFTGTRAGVRFEGWEGAFEALLALGADAADPVPVVVDELPWLLDGAPEIPSILQGLLSPRGEAVRAWRTRLVLCGSALSTMRSLLAGSAPLRGRAGLELVVHPFDYRQAAAFWGVDGTPDLAVRLHALVGGTPAYRDLCGGSGPASAAEFDGWVAGALLDPSSAMFREGNVLLAEEPRVTDTALYRSVLAAISQGRTRRGEIAAAIGRAEGALAHPLTVLTEARLVQPLGDALRQRRTTYHLAEPILRFHQLVVAPNEARLARHRGAEVWAEVAATVSSRIEGPHFEELARTWCLDHAAPATVGGRARAVEPTQVACRQHGTSHEVDVVVLGPPTELPRPRSGTAAGRPPRTAGRGVPLAVGEAKWRSTPCDVEQLRRLEHVRDLLGVDGPVKLLVFARRGFTRGLQAEAARRADVELVDLERLYHGD